MDQMGLLWSRGVHGGEAESLFRKGSSRLVAAIAECLHTANIRRFSQPRRERGPYPRTRPVSQRQQAKRLACHLDTCLERAIYFFFNDTATTEISTLSYTTLFR